MSFAFTAAFGIRCFCVGCPFVQSIDMTASLLISCFVLALVCTGYAYSPSLDVRTAPLSPEAVRMRSDRIETTADNLTLTRFSPVTGPPRTWVYIDGSGFVGNVSVRFLPDETLCDVAVYDENSLGVAVPETQGTITTIEVVTDNGTVQASTPFVVAAPVRPPVLSSLAALTSAVGCYNYLHGDNFVLGATTVELGIPGQATVLLPIVHYSYESIGFTVPEQLQCVKEAWNGGVNVMMQTPYGTAVSQFKFVLQQGSC